MATRGVGQNSRTQVARVERSDADLWQEICAGNEPAWRLLVDRYKALVYSVCTCTGLTLTESADVFQDTWLQLFKYRRSLQDPSRISSWLVTTARREAVRVRKRNARLVAQVDSEAPDRADLPDALPRRGERRAGALGRPAEPALGAARRGARLGGDRAHAARHPHPRTGGNRRVNSDRHALDLLVKRYFEL